MSIFPRPYRKKKSGYARALSSGILILGLALAAPAAYAGMGGGGGGGGGGAAGAGGNAEAAHRSNGQTELTTCPQGMVWNAKDQRCLARHGGVRPGAQAD